MAHFTDFQFNQKLQDGLDSMGFETPTPIQQQAIPVILDGKDLIACAQTGTGKTAAYLLPVMHKIASVANSNLNTLIIAPTRELAQQIDQQVEGFAYFTGISSICVYGGNDGNAFAQQQKAMREGADIVIATPGRLLAMLTSSGSVDMNSVQHLILDEADRMLDMGFYEDIVRIINYLPKQRQTLLFSATMPPKIRQLANRILNEPAQINIAISKPAEGILQQAYMAYDNQKMALLKSILNTHTEGSIILFASTKDKVKELERDLKRNGMPIKAFHSDLEQAEREEIMRAFRNRDIRMLIGTDILSRGIDVDGIGLVVNYDVPPDPEDYVHRIGRTARAETTGTAITFINPKDARRFYDIEQLIGNDITKLELPQGLGEAPAYEPQKRMPKPQGKRTFGKNKKFNNSPKTNNNQRQKPH
ncbi:MAG: DEAD/DEAH box helicase [Bacteroidia bacterium]|jgi:superfamily II DNA/RNA helicase|nr:DEAD/DEAH box helicase [Bacteroidia bacterium]